MAASFEGTQSMEAMSELRSLPSVDLLANQPGAAGLINQYGRSLTVEAIRFTLDEIRSSHEHGKGIPNSVELIKRCENTLEEWTKATLVEVINATGVILHTNLGRALLSRSAINAVERVAASYSTLEYDLQRGKRGTRLIHAEALLTRLTGAQAGFAVNNNASALLLILTGLAKRRAVVIARSQLVEIGGGFRVPDVMKQSGARLVEIGTTNRVHLSDYINAVEESNPALILRAHRSNFRIIGFTSEPGLDEISKLARERGIPLVDDLGSGALLDTGQYGLGHEPMVVESLSQGADLVCFSGDKLVGGPQAGIIVGRSDLVKKLKKHPLARAIRADKLCLAGLSATLFHYLKGEAEQEIPVWRMIASPLENLKERVERWAGLLQNGTVVEGNSTVGGGSLPEETLRTWLLAIKVRSPNSLLDKLRAGHPAVIARLEDDMVVFDPRTVLPEQDEVMIDQLRKMV